MNSNADRAALELGEAIDRHRPEIERRWLERVQRDICNDPSVEESQLRDAIPDYLVALVELLQRRRGERLDLTAHEAWSTVAREHGVARVQIGFDIDQLVHEFILLRHTIRDIAVADLQDDRGADAVLADILDAAIAAAVRAYVEARDYQARREQAKHIGFLIHELRNPLGAGMLAAAELRHTAPTSQQRHLGVVERSLRRLNELIDGVLLNEKLEADEADIRPVELEFERLLDQALEGARAEANRKGLGFRVKCDSAIRVRLDPRLTSSAIQNVADNAVKYTDSGEVEVSVDDVDDEIVLHVRDNCQGLSDEELRTIFEPFRRGRTGKAGTGLGLAIARNAVEAQGGHIDAESSGPHGCHFWITLPKQATLQRS